MTARSPHDEILSIMALAPVIPALTVRDAEDGVAQAKALLAGGLRAIEATLRTPGRALSVGRQTQKPPRRAIEGAIRNVAENKRALRRPGLRPLQLRRAS
jgi:2-keto-3-deoxy-6-phosphogluconate aldolase